MVELGQKYIIEIEDLGHKGEGVGRIQGFTIFVDQGIPGDLLQIQIKVLKRNYARGEIVKIVQPSEDRVRPKCPYAKNCGGCQLMHMTYRAQLDNKNARIKETLERLGKIKTKVEPILGMEDPYRYRNKGQFPLGKMGEETTIGLYQKGSHNIVDIDKCLIQEPGNENIIAAMREYIKISGASIYNEATGKGLIRHLCMRVAFKTDDVMVIIVTKNKNIPQKEKLIEIFTQKVPGLKSIIQNINGAKTNVIFGRENIKLYGKEKITDYIGDIKFNISPLSFFQVNTPQSQVLYDKVVDYADLTGNENVFDIYCGIGSIGLYLARKAKKVIGVELVEEAVKDARENARINNIKNAEFYTGRAEDLIPQLYKEGTYADLVVVDPPRKGCDERVLETMVKMKPKKIVYVSCNPATLARDLAYLEERGYKTMEVQPVDMFPHTAHVECIALIQREIM